MKLTFKNFIYTGEEERILILNWRNSERVRLNMIDSKIIETADHLRWMAALAERSDCLYFLVYDDEEAIGVLDFTSMNESEKSAEWGFYLKPKTRPGFGAVGFLGIENYFLHWNYEILIGRVLAGNLKSCQWHKRLLFEETGLERPGLEGGLEAGTTFGFRLTRKRWLARKKALAEELFAGGRPPEAVWLR